MVLMELGVLHYFLDLAPLLEVAARLLRPGGQLLLRDFHPVSTKLITSRGKKHKVAGKGTVGCHEYEQAGKGSMLTSEGGSSNC